MALISHWRLDGNADDVMAAHSGSGGTFFSSGRVWTGGVVGSGKDITGCAEHADFQTSNFTYCVWVYITDTGPQVLCDRYVDSPDAGHGFQLATHTDNKLKATFGGGELGTKSILYSIGTLLYGAWTHVAIAYDSGTCNMYINGVLDSSPTITDMYSATNTGITAFAFAPVGGPHSDDVRYYNETLDSTAIGNIYTADVASGAILYKVHATDGDFTTWDNMAIACQNSHPLVSNILVYLQGGQSYGDDDGTNELLGLADGVANNKTITITTDPSELATPSKILGAIRQAASNGILLIKKVKHSATGDASNGPIASVKASLEDVFGCYTVSADAPNIVTSSSSGAISKNCTFCITFNYSGEHLFGPVSNGNSFNNCIFLFYDASNDIQMFGAINDSLNCVVYNYNTGKTVDIIGGAFTGLTTGNPNLAGTTMVTAYNEAPATMIARDAHLTAGSSACIGTADSGTATATDIEGISRA